MSTVLPPLSEPGRLRLARCVVEDGWSLRRAAERFPGCGHDDGPRGLPLPHDRAAAHR
jgi:hypothetical protein